MKWWNRLEQIMEAKGLTADDIAERSGIPIKSVYGYLKGAVANPRGEVLRKLSAALGVTEIELRFGATDQKIVNLSKIPLLTLNEIGTLDRLQRPVEAWDGVAYVSVPDGLVSANGFAIVLTDDSAAPDAKAGDIIVCDPDVPVVPGKFVVAKIDKLRAGLVARFRPISLLDNEQFKLVPANPDYPEVIVDSSNPGHVVARAFKVIKDL